MGHLGHLREEYRDLVTRLEAGQVGLPEPQHPVAWEGWRSVLEIAFTPEQAALASRLPVKPAKLETIARRLGEDPEAVRPRLDAMCDKGLVIDLVSPRTGETRYALAPPVVGFFEFSFMRAHDMWPKKSMAEALDAYVNGDPAFAREVFGFATTLGRAVAHEGPIAAEAQPDVLDWERATGLIARARKITVSLCYCRHKAEHAGHACDTPQETCLSLDGGADFVARRGFGREIDRAEALDILAKARKAGLVQIADNAQQRPIYLCNCCGCCCGQLRAINDWDLDAVNPSGFEPELHSDQCNGCSRCARACPITAIAMQAERKGASLKNELRPVFDRERCIGCGVCATACKRDGISLVRREAPSYVPETSLERTIRMALERGRLPHLLFDEGSSRGAHFLNRALQALQKLPPVERALASEQVTSRFLRVALGVVKDPTAPSPPRGA